MRITLTDKEREILEKIVLGGGCEYLELDCTRCPNIVCTTCCFAAEDAKAMLQIVDRKEHDSLKPWVCPR